MPWSSLPNILHATLIIDLANLLHVICSPNSKIIQHPPFTFISKIWESWIGLSNNMASHPNMEMLLNMHK
jgi:hypothetical protein